LTPVNQQNMKYLEACLGQAPPKYVTVPAPPQNYDPVAHVDYKYCQVLNLFGPFD